MLTVLCFCQIISLIGIAGGCRREELYEMSLDDIEETSTQLVITIPFSKTNKRRVFTVIDEMDSISVLELFRRYVTLRPKGLGHNKLFVGYRNGKCISQRVGIHTVGGVPKKMAQFLGLANPELYTGHSFRRTSATLLANAGAEFSVLKRHGGWKSSSVAEKYIEDSLEGKRKVAKMIQGGESFVQVLTEKSKEIIATSASSSSTFHDVIPRLEIIGNTDCTINVNVKV